VLENQDMTSVGTPIYVAPEVMRGDRYDSRCDSYSFGVCLLAMCRGEKHIIEYYMQALRKSMKRKTGKGVGMSILNNRIYNKGWRPLLPVETKRCFPKLSKLITDCWSAAVDVRPGFDDIVGLLQGEIGDEVRYGGEPAICLLGLEDDNIYHERMNKREEREREEEGGGGMEDELGELKRKFEREQREKQDLLVVVERLKEELSGLRGGEGRLTAALLR